MSVSAMPSRPGSSCATRTVSASEPGATRPNLLSALAVVLVAAEGKDAWAVVTVGICRRSIEVVVQNKASGGAKEHSAESSRCGERCRFGGPGAGGKGPAAHVKHC